MKKRALFKDDHHITILYNSANSHDRKCYAASKSLDKHSFGIDLNHAKIKSMEWLEIAEMLEMNPEDLISKNHPNFKDLYGDGHVELDTFSALKVLQRHPETLIYPIAVRDHHAILLKSKHEIYRLDDEE